jgi:hypothetical protein
MLDAESSNLKLDTRANKNLKLDSRANKARKQSKPAPDTGTNLAQQQGMKLDTRDNKNLKLDTRDNKAALEPETSEVVSRTVSFGEGAQLEPIPGTLQHRIHTLLPKTGEKPETEAKHICRWTQKVRAGWTPFQHDLMLQRGKANPKPLVFALLTNGDKFIQVAHGFGAMALDSDEHPYNGDLGCFIGDRWVTEIQGAHILQDPTFVTMPADMTEPFISIKTASNGTIKKMGENDTLLAGNPKSATASHRTILPPSTFGMGTLLHEATPIGQRGIRIMSKKLRHWAKGNQEMREGSTMVLTWL